MNYIFPSAMLISLIFAAAGGRLSQTVAAAFSGAEAAVASVIAMAGVFCFWTGFLKIAEKSGFSGVLAKIISPALSRLFPKIKREEKAFSKISMNIVANLLGMGNAATPAGIEAMAELDRKNGYCADASDEMCMLVAINTASLQLIPTTVMAMRTAGGAKNPGAVIVPIWIASFAALTAAVVMMRHLPGRRKT